MNQSNFSELMKSPPVTLWEDPEENHFTQTSPTPALYIFLPPEGQKKINLQWSHHYPWARKTAGERTGD